ncbi:MAG: Fur family transcriptional regulator [Clostridia bacterium]
MPEKKTFQDLLNSRGLKNTKHRNFILNLIEQYQQPLTVEAVYLQLKAQRITISLSTVYRVIEVLLSKGILLKTNVQGDQRAFFEINKRQHKHHLLCLKCRKMLAVDGCPLSAYEKTLEASLGFAIQGHNLEIYGLCASCKDQE